MGVEPLVRRVDQSLVDRRLVLPLLVAGYQRIRFSLRIEGEGRPPNLRAVVSLEAQSFMLACFDPLSVSTWGRPIFGPANSMPLVSVRGLGRAKSVYQPSRPSKDRKNLSLRRWPKSSFFFVRSSRHR